MIRNHSDHSNTRVPLVVDVKALCLVLEEIDLLIVLICPRRIAKDVMDENTVMLGQISIVRPTLRNLLIYKLVCNSSNGQPAKFSSTSSRSNVNVPQQVIARFRQLRRQLVRNSRSGMPVPCQSVVILKDPTTYSLPPLLFSPLFSWRYVRRILFQEEREKGRETGDREKETRDCQNLSAPTTIPLAVVDWNRPCSRRETGQEICRKHRRRRGRHHRSRPLLYHYFDPWFLHAYRHLLLGPPPRRQDLRPRLPRLGCFLLDLDHGLHSIYVFQHHHHHHHLHLRRSRPSRKILAPHPKRTTSRQFEYLVLTHFQHIIGILLLLQAFHVAVI